MNNFDSIFLTARELSAGERRAFLEEACGSDAELRGRLERMLHKTELADAFFADTLEPDGATPTEKGGTDEPSPIGECEGSVIDRYKLLQKIGEGGMGTVFMAQQEEPVRRRVALKIIKLGMDTKQVVARFEAERQALALMDHPSIARVLDAGTTEAGRPYFVMELVRGTKVTDFCTQHGLSTAARLRLFIQICQAVQHAHQKGVIHRDLKPSNILVTSDDGEPLPKVIDFGIAKATADTQLTDKTLFTRFDLFIGTPAYMSPEQAEFSAHDVDTRTDIYSLGVLLYELLTGHLPFDTETWLKSGLDAMRKAIRETEPTRPSTRLRMERVAAGVPPPGGRRAEKQSSVTEQSRAEQPERDNPNRRPPTRELIAQLRGDLDWIVLKALEKDRTRRYATANGFAADIQRHLDDEPIVARSPSLSHRVGRLIRRNRLAFAAATVVILALALGVGGVMFVQYRANQDYRRRLYVSDLNRAGVAWQNGQAAEMRTFLDRCPPDLRHWEWNFLHQQRDRWEQKVLVTSTNLGDVAFAADASLMVVANEGMIQVRAIPSGEWLRNIPVKSRTQGPLALAPRGDLLAVVEPADGNITIWNVLTAELVSAIPYNSPSRTTRSQDLLRLGSVHDLDGLAWSHDGQRLAFANDDTDIRIWNAKSGLREPAFMATAVSNVLALAFSPDDKTLAVGTMGPDIQLLDAATGALRRTLRSLAPSLFRLKFSPDGRNLAACNKVLGAHSRENRVWNMDDEGGTLDLGTGSESFSFDFSADSRRLVVGDGVGTIRIWDLDQRFEVERFTTHGEREPTLRLLPDNRILAASKASRSLKSTISLWQASGSGFLSLKGYSDPLRILAFSPDSRRLVAAGASPNVFAWDARDGHLAGSYTGHASNPALAMAVRDDGLVASADTGKMVRMWDPVSFETKWETVLPSAPNAYWLAFSPDGRLLYVQSKYETLTVLDAATGRRLNSISGLGYLDGIAVSPDGRRIALCQKVKLSIHRAEDLQEVWSAAAVPERCAVFSPDGQWLATGDHDGAVTLWEMASAGRVRRSLRGHSGAVLGVSFHPDGRRLVSSSYDGRVKVWDWRSGEDLLTLTPPGGSTLWLVVFSPDGKTIAAAGGDGIVSLWRVE